MKNFLYILPAMMALPVSVPMSHAHSPAPLTAQSQNLRHVEPVSHTLSVFSGYFNLKVDASDGVSSHDNQVTKQGGLWQRLLAVTRNAKLPFEVQRLTFRKLQKRHGVALMHLHAPEQLVIAQAIGTKETLLWENGHNRLINNTELAARYTGEVLVWRESEKVAWKINEPIRYLTPDSIGGTSQIIESVSLHNSGTKPLTLEVASTSCGCTGATITPKVLPPGGSGVLTAKMDAIDNRLVTVKLRSDDPARPHALIALQSQMPQGIRPPATVMLNSQKGQSATASTVIQLPAGITVVKALTGQPWLQASFAPVPSTATTPPRLLYRVRVTLGADAPAGRMLDEITLQLQNSPVRKLIVPVSGFISNDITVTPALISLAKAPRGSAIRKSVVVRGPADRPFSIRAIRGSSPHVQGRADPDVVATAHAVDIRIDVMGEVGASLQERVTLSLSDERTLSVDVIGTVIEPGSAVDSAPTLRVGQLAPHFSAVDSRGVARRLSDLKGKMNLLLTFFPQCFTGGCAGQLASLQLELEKFVHSDTEIWAISVDDVDVQTAFSDRLGLQYPLIPDTDRKLSLLYNAAQDKTDLAARQSVLIDKFGIVRWVDSNVNVQTHGADVLVKMRELNMSAP